MHNNPKIDEFIEMALKYDDKINCLIWPFGRNDRGYAYVQRLGYIARLICIKIYGLPPTNKHEAAHSCGNGHLGCINYHHLRWATHKENCLDDCCGENHHRAKLTEEQVLEIRNYNIAKKYTPKELAEKYNIHNSQIYRIINYKSYRLPMKDLFK